MKSFAQVSFSFIWLAEQKKTYPCAARFPHHVTGWLLASDSNRQLKNNVIGCNVLDHYHILFNHTRWTHLCALLSVTSVQNITYLIFPLLASEECKYKKTWDIHHIVGYIYAHINWKTKVFLVNPEINWPDVKVMYFQKKRNSAWEICLTSSFHVYTQTLSRLN